MKLLNWTTSFLIRLHGFLEKFIWIKTLLNMAIKVWVPPKGFLEKRVNHPKSYHVLIDCKMCLYEQLRSCKQTQQEVRSRPAVCGVFKMLLCSSADGKTHPSNCCFTKLWRSLWHLSHPVLSLIRSNYKPKESKPSGSRDCTNPLLLLRWDSSFRTGFTAGWTWLLVQHQSITC